MVIKTKYVFKYIVLNEQCWIKIHVFPRRRSGIPIVNKFNCSKIHRGQFIHRSGTLSALPSQQKSVQFHIFCNNTLTITTLRQLSKISVDNCVQQHEQTLGQLFQLGILCRKDLHHKDKFV